MASHKVLLKGNQTAASLQKEIEAHGEKTSFADVILVCEDNVEISAHQVLLCSSSPFFKRLLLENEKHFVQQPKIIISWISKATLQNVLNFLYCGSVFLETSQIETFKSILHSLEISTNGNVSGVLGQGNNNELENKLEAENKFVLKNENISDEDENEEVDYGALDNYSEDDEEGADEEGETNEEDEVGEEYEVSNTSLRSDSEGKMVKIPIVSTAASTSFRKFNFPLDYLDGDEARSLLSQYIMVTYILKGGRSKRVKHGKAEFMPSWWPNHLLPWSKFGNLKLKFAYSGPGSKTEFLRTCLRLCLEAHGIDPDNHVTENMDLKKLEGKIKEKEKKGQAKPVSQERDKIEYDDYSDLEANEEKDVDCYDDFEDHSDGENASGEEDTVRDKSESDANPTAIRKHSKGAIISGSFRKLDYPLEYLNFEDARSLVANYINITYFLKGGKKKRLKTNGDAEFMPLWWPNKLWHWSKYTGMRNKFHYTGPGNVTKFSKTCIRLCLEAHGLDHRKYVTENMDQKKLEARMQYFGSGSVRDKGFKVDLQEILVENENFLKVEQAKKDMAPPKVAKVKVKKSWPLREKGEFICPECGIVCTTQRGLTTHHQYAHLKIRHPCDQCGYQAANRSQLRIHIAGAHEGKRYYCDQCDFIAKSSNLLSNHIRYKHLESTVTYSCDLCKFTTKYRKCLKIHVDAVHLKIKHDCTVCSFQCSTAGHLKIHLMKKHGIDNRRTQKNFSKHGKDFKVESIANQ